jgi:two-component system nitrate/nitrite response regulator NarL
MISIFIAAAIKLYREGLALSLQQTSGFEVVATAAAPCQFGGALTAQPDAVLLLDVADADGGASLIQVLAASPGLRVVALGVRESAPEILDCAEAGASGYVTRDGSLAELITAIESVARDELTCPPRIAGALIHRVATLAAESRQHAVSARLSRREMEIITLIERGLSNKEIARQLFIALATVKNHVHNILDKLEVHGRDEAAAWMRRHRLDQVVGA